MWPFSLDLDSYNEEMRTAFAFGHLGPNDRIRIILVSNF